ncbi:rhamnogalacturonan acetylesterase [Sphingomonas sp.]|uniref:rhamnogalacturonan acetylesterase n=1 Tax=Sphingomonas sp. TaxID=28214 RepID=UPI000DB3B1CB|nr:rhamnogalacturonan acetylesterase [Sphingomonas sp.]PZU07564.1 MAG: rhamnogalacturonan acetylesterase [Sphingomonas sp.]
MSLIGMLGLLAMATMPPPLSFDLALGGQGVAVARRHLYERGDYGFEPGSRPDAFLFSAAVPEGTYRVTVRLGDSRSAGDTTVKAEARRLMLLNVPTARGRFVERSFLVNVRTDFLPPPPPNAPGGDAVRIDAKDRNGFAWDDKLTLEFLGNPRVASIRIEPATAPTLYLAGDSTVTDQDAEPAASWGQMLPAMLDDQVVVANHAKSGETLKSFLTGLRLDKILSTIRPGDWLFIQFGHNDQKSQWPQTYVDKDLTYPAYLRAYIAEARRRGANPVLVTSPERRNWDAGGHIAGTLTDYANAVRAVAAEQKVPLIDLNADSKAIYEALGEQKAPIAFNDNGADKTHHDNYGAWLLASAVAERIRETIPALAPHVTMPPFSPAHLPTPEALHIPPSLAFSGMRPAGS